MSFVRSAFAAVPLHTREEVMAEQIRVAVQLDMPDRRGAAVCAGMCVSQEVGADPWQSGKLQFWTPGNNADPCFAANPAAFPHDSMGDDSRSVGPYQQQTSAPPPAPQWGWGGKYGDPEGTRKRMDLHESTTMFLATLKRAGYDASSAQAANDSIQRVQKSGAPQEYAKHWPDVNVLYDRVAAGIIKDQGEGTVGVSGDPLWLEDVLRPDLGDRLKTLPGWQDSGVGGTMQEIWGVVWHHTGNALATAASIRAGRPDLKGPLAQLHIAQDGTVTIVAVGPCNHAGKGSWVGLPTDDANDRTIGIECAYPKDVNNQHELWPDAQIIAMRDTGAALTKHLGVDVSHNISHYEWAQRGPAGIRQGKTDPWNLDMGWFRGEIAKDIAGAFDNPLPPPAKVFPQGYTDRELLEYIATQLKSGAK